jgi:hypothetical protein
MYIIKNGSKIFPNVKAIDYSDSISINFQRYFEKETCTSL